MVLEGGISQRNLEMVSLWEGLMGWQRSFKARLGEDGAGRQLCQQREYRTPSRMMIVACSWRVELAMVVGKSSAVEST